MVLSGWLVIALRTIAFQTLVNRSLGGGVRSVCHEMAKKNTPVQNCGCACSLQSPMCARVCAAPAHTCREQKGLVLRKKGSQYKLGKSAITLRPSEASLLCVRVNTFLDRGQVCFPAILHTVSPALTPSTSKYTDTHTIVVQYNTHMLRCESYQLLLLMHTTQYSCVGRGAFDAVHLRGGCTDAIPDSMASRKLSCACSADTVAKTPLSICFWTTGFDHLN